MKKSVLTFILTLAVPGLAAAQRVGPYIPAPGSQAAGHATAAAGSEAAAAPHIAERYGLAPLAELSAASVAAAAQVEAVRVWNETHHRPRHTGFERALPAARQVVLGAVLGGGVVAPEAGGLLVQSAVAQMAWGGTVHVDNAYRLRLHLASARLPAGTQMWVHGGGQTAGPFGSELAGADGSLWTPIVRGPDVAIDVVVPAAALAGKGGYGFTIDKVAELLELEAVDSTTRPKDDMSCNVDAECFSSSDFPAIETARHAIALIEFVGSGFTGQCTGQLLNDSKSDGIPYMLTANHCISTAGEANSLEAWYDYYTPSCNAPMPELGGQPMSNGATLLATGDANTSSDFTLMRLDNLPGGRTFLGWDANAADIPDGTILYRLSQPEGQTQNYNTTRVDSTVQQCAGTLIPEFIYSDLVVGATFDGSSGSAAMLSNGDVVGQLYGGCGPSDDCDPQQSTVDGAFSHSFPSLAPFLAPSGGGGGTPSVCRPDQFTLCLMSRRFQVEVDWTNQFNGSSGRGGAIVGTDSTGYFFFTDATNYELIVKILDQSNVIKVYYGELTDLQFTITVTDLDSGTVKTYQNSPGDCGAIDEDAFSASATGDAAPVAGAAKLRLLGTFGTVVGGGAAHAAAATRGTCVPAPGTLCLDNRRFKVTTDWMNQFNGQSGTGLAKSLSDISGLFTFTDPTVVELVTKVVEFTDRVAFYYASLTDFEFNITVEDTIGGTTKTYHNAAGNYCGGLDNSAFPP
jgi:lysyl endopeptidase